MFCSRLSQKLVQHGPDVPLPRVGHTTTAPGDASRAFDSAVDRDWIGAHSILIGAVRSHFLLCADEDGNVGWLSQVSSPLGFDICSIPHRSIDRSVSQRMIDMVTSYASRRDYLVSRLQHAFHRDLCFIRARSCRVLILIFIVNMLPTQTAVGRAVDIDLRMFFHMLSFVLF